MSLLGIGKLFNSKKAEYEARHAAERAEQFDGRGAAPTAVIYRSELDYMSRCILDYPDIETGGELFGFWTSVGTPIVAYVTGPGENARHNRTSFIQDPEYPNAVGNELHRKYGLLHIGEWHSHHQLGLAQPSGGDVDSILYGLGKPGFPRLLLCIGNCTPQHTTVNAFNFFVNDGPYYAHASWDVIDTESPYRPLADRDLKHVLIHPRTRNASHGQMRLVQRRSAAAEAPRVHWLTENVQNVETMKQFIAVAQQLCPQCKVAAEILPSGEPVINVGQGAYEAVLPFGFPSKSPVLKGDPEPAATAARWNPALPSLVDSFRLWLEPIVRPVDEFPPIFIDPVASQPAQHMEPMRPAQPVAQQPKHPAAPEDMPAQQ